MTPVSSQASRTTWQRTARRIRVPLGFVVAAVFLLFAEPTARTLWLSLFFVLSGLALRAYAAGYVRKNAELTRTGPYAHTRNPLYLGSAFIAFGFVLAAGRWWLAILVLGLFAAIYIPTIRSEEGFLRATFPGFEAYARAVPRFWPSLAPARFADLAPTSGSPLSAFSPERYLRHREYNASMGAGVLYAGLLLRMVLLRGRA